MHKLKLFLIVLVFISIDSLGNCQISIQNVNGEDSIVYRTEVAQAFYSNFLDGEDIASVKSTIYDNYPIKRKNDDIHAYELGPPSKRVKFKVSIEVLQGEPELVFVDTLNHNWELLERFRPSQVGDSTSISPVEKVYVSKSSYKKVIVCFKLNDTNYKATITLNGSKKTVSKMYNLEYIPKRYFNLFLSFLRADFIDAELLYEKQYYFTRI
jgi:hypothetical protein